MKNTKKSVYKLTAVKDSKTTVITCKTKSYADTMAFILKHNGYSDIKTKEISSKQS